MRLRLPKARVRNAFTCAVVQPLRAHAQHDMLAAHFDGREVGHSNLKHELRAL